MSLSRYAKRRDKNETEIIKALESLGCMVWQLDRPVDLLIGRKHYFALIEVKDGSLAPSRRVLTPGQIKFFGETHCYPTAVVESVNDLEETLLILDGINESARATCFLPA
jgi:hypothetical protein